MKFAVSLDIGSDFLLSRLTCARRQSGDLGDRRGLVLDARRLTLLSLAFARARDFNGSITTRRTLEPWTSHFQREREHGIGSNEPPAPVTSAQLILGVMNSASFATIPNAREISSANAVEPPVRTR